jgi:hypothetical protein
MMHGQRNIKLVQLCVKTVTLCSANLLEIPSRLTQNAAILTYCCNWHLPYWQNVKAQLSLTTAKVCRVAAVTAGSSFILFLCRWWLSGSNPGLLIPDTNWAELFVYSNFYLHAPYNTKSSCPILISNSVPSPFQPTARSLYYGCTVEQQQRTDRLDVSNTVDIAGGIVVRAAATADGLFCSRF